MYATQEEGVCGDRQEKRIDNESWGGVYNGRKLI